MALITCHECKSEVSSEAQRCPKCGAAVRSKQNHLVALAGAAIVIAGMWFYFGGGLEQQAASQVDKIYSQVASDAVQQYEIAKRSGTPMDVCIHAGVVSAAYLQSKDESGYRQWKDTERSDCGRAGLPVQ